ncbi:hypothetical protein ACF3N7_05185 [Cruoricaptor ignavus]|uniref:hypothetical protein n=1 Tax=Cruoricaptor ignavus TaxID=1118202 RepID=UPI00370D5A5A
MRNFLLVTLLLVLSCQKDKRTEIEKELTESAEKYLKNGIDVSGEDVVIDSLKLIKFDSLTPKDELFFVAYLYEQKLDSLLKDSEARLAKAKEYSSLEIHINKPKEKIIENLELSKLYSDSQKRILDKADKADSTTFLGYIGNFNVKATNLKSREGFKLDSVTMFFYPDFTVMDKDDYSKKLLKKYK